MQNMVSNLYVTSRNSTLPLVSMSEADNHAGQNRCADCLHNSHCIAQHLEPHELDRFSRLVRPIRKLAPGESLFRMGEAFNSLYTVHSGTLKVYTLDKEGQEQVMGFYLPGDIVGVDAIGHNAYPSFAEALETAAVCEIPYRAFTTKLPEIEGLQRQLVQTMSAALRVQDQHVMLLGKKNAEQRFASFLISLSRRFARLGYSPYELRLCMSRSDIGNYIGLAMETVSRLFSKFQELGLIRVEPKAVAIEDLAILERLLLGPVKAGARASNAS